MEETLEIVKEPYMTNQVECSFSRRKILGKVSGRPCTSVVVGVGNGGDDIVRIPCLPCTGFPSVRHYWNFYTRQVIGLIRQNFPFVHMRCAERVASTFVYEFLDKGTHICPLLDNNAPYVVLQVQMDIRLRKDRWREGMTRPVPRSFKFDLTRLPDFSSKEQVSEVSGVSDVSDDDDGDDDQVMEEVSEEEEEAASTPKMKRPCDHVYIHPQTLTIDWYYNPDSCPICTHHHHQQPQ